MKHIFLIVIMTAIASFVFAGIDYQNTRGDIEVSFTNNDFSARDKLYQIVALPSEEVEITIDKCDISVFSEDGKFLRNEQTLRSDRVCVSGNFVMRELFGHQIELTVNKDENGEISKIRQIDFTIKAVNEKEVPPHISAAFLPLYRSFVDNYSVSYLRDVEVVPSKMLIITHSNTIGELTNYINWKNQRGIATETVAVEDIGSTSTQIKSYIRNIYDSTEIPPDYLLLIGDVDDDFEIPSYYISEENDVTDLPYTLLAGDDYFPEMLVGRFSIDSIVELITMTNKVITYEKNPYMQDPSWLTRALLIAGNYSTTPPTPTTPVIVTKWLRDKMYDYGYSHIDEIYYPPVQDASSQASASINNGVGFVSYRGWGDANGWHYPEFHSEDVQNLNNGELLPVITSIVCNTGDFANNVDPCFGETWLRSGWPTLPKGAVAFVGPSDLHTNTKYNNSILAGFYYGLLDEGNFTFGSDVLRGKLELYDNFPLELGQGQKVEFYFHVYNILGDPSLMMWTGVPQEISCNLPNEISVGTNYLEINLSSALNGAVVTAFKDGEFVNTAIVNDGSAIVYLNSQTTGTVTVTITKPTYHAFVQDITVINDDIDIGLESYQFSGNAAGENVQLSATLKNYGSQTVNSVSAELVSGSQFVNITSGSVDFGNIAAGASATEIFQFQILPACPNNSVLEFSLNLSDGTILKLQLISSGMTFEVQHVTVNDDNGVIEPGEERQITIELQNTGNVDVSGLNGTLVSLGDAAYVTSAGGNFGNIVAGSNATAEFTIGVNTDCYRGRQISFRLDCEDANGLVSSGRFTLEVGIVDNTQPTGGDAFGYYAYDSFDTSFSEAPVYQWREIDPNEGGSGEVILMGDDESESVPLPFDFPYYGVVSDSITISSNGWISFRTTWTTFFRNWTIPSALGPYGSVAAYWDDLIPASDNIRICYDYDASADIFVIEWNNCVNRFDQVSVEKFEIILYNPETYPTADGNGEIQVNYHTVNNPDANNNYATVGIENFQQSDGVLYTFANIYPASATELQNGLAIKFTTDAPDSYTLIGDNEIQNENIILSNFPNPFLNSTTISFQISNEQNQQNEQKTLSIYNIKGQKVKQLRIKNYKLGINKITWNGNDNSGKSVSAGIYLYRLETTSGKSALKKCLLLKN